MLTDIIPLNGLTESETLRIGASIEQGSEHPLADAIVEAAHERGLSLVETVGFHGIPGYGVDGWIEGKRVLFGNVKLMKKEGIPLVGLQEAVVRLADEGKRRCFWRSTGRRPAFWRLPTQ